MSDEARVLILQNQNLCLTRGFQPSGLPVCPPASPRRTTPGCPIAIALSGLRSIKRTLPLRVGKLFRAHSNGVKFIPDIIQARPSVLELNREDRQALPDLYAFISSMMCKERIIVFKVLRLAYRRKQHVCPL